MRWLFAFIAAAVASACEAPQTWQIPHEEGWRATGQLPDEWPQALDRLRRVGRTIATEVEQDGIGSITAALARDGEVLWWGAYGWSDPEARVPAGRGTIYRTGSVSKSVTAVLMAILAEDGTVGLATPLHDLVPEIGELMDRPAEANPTLRQVASHTAGLAREPELPDAAAGPIENWTGRILESIRTTRYRTAPGTEYSYSNIGFGILGFGLERAAAVPFMDQVEARIFEPLGMTSSTFIIDDRLQPSLSVGHANGPDGEVDTEQPAREHDGRGYKVPNGGVYSTVDDLAAFAAGVMGRGRPPLFGEAMRAEVLSVQTPENPESGYGLGFSINTVDGRVFAGHGGSVAGYTAYLLFEPATGLTAVLLRNYNRGRTSLGEAAASLLGSLTAG